MSAAGKRKTWLIVIFLVPLAIYLFYFYLGSREAGKAGETEQLPQSYLEAGTSTKINEGTYRVGSPGSKIAYYDTLKAGNNNIMPEPGFIFAVIPVLTPSPGEGGQPNRVWTLIDETGRGYKPLTTDTGRLSNLKRLENQDILPSTEPEYLIFKVRTGIQTFYLKLFTDQNTFYWRLPGS